MSAIRSIVAGVLIGGALLSTPVRSESLGVPMRDFPDHFNKAAKAAGIATRIVLTKCIRDAPVHTCQIGVGKSLAGVLAAETDRITLRDIMIILAKNGEGLELITTIGVLMMLLEPLADANERGAATVHLLGPAREGKTSFDSEVTLRRTLFKASAIPAVGLLITVQRP